MIALPTLDLESLQALKGALPTDAFYEPVRDAINQHLGAPIAAPAAMDIDDPETSSRRTHIANCIRAIVVSDQVEGIEDIVSVVGSDLAVHVFWLIGQKFPE